MASEETWAKLKYFKKDSVTDKWGSIHDIDDNLLLRLDDFRAYIGVPIYVTSGVSSKGHASKSYHYVANGACAVDIVIPDYENGPIDLILDAQRFGFTGIGYYPHWKYANNTVGGLHIDMRPLKWDKDLTINYRYSRWMGIMREGSQIYIPMTYNNLLKFGGSNGIS